jgi:hypothetical protein
MVISSAYEGDGAAMAALEDLTKGALSRGVLTLRAVKVVGSPVGILLRRGAAPLRHRRRARASSGLSRSRRGH